MNQFGVMGHSVAGFAPVCSAVDGVASTGPMMAGLARLTIAQRAFAEHLGKTVARSRLRGTSLSWKTTGWVPSMDESR